MELKNLNFGITKIKNAILMKSAENKKTASVMHAVMIDADMLAKQLDASKQASAKRLLLR